MAQPNPPLSILTRAGRMLLLCHILLFLGGTTLYVEGLLPLFPAGSYPLMMFLVPIGIACCFLFAILALMLEKLVIRIYRR